MKDYKDKDLEDVIDNCADLESLDPLRALISEVRKDTLEEVEKKVINIYNDDEFTKGRDRGVWNGHRYACQAVIDYLTDELSLLKTQKGNKND